MEVTGEVAMFAGRCADLGVEMDSIAGGDDYFYRKFPILIVKNGCFEEMFDYVTSNKNATASDVIGEFNRLMTEKTGGINPTTEIIEDQDDKGAEVESPEGLMDDGDLSGDYRSGGFDLSESLNESVLY
mgnify:CR=1 FL=1